MGNDKFDKFTKMMLNITVAVVFGAPFLLLFVANIMENGMLFALGIFIVLPIVIFLVYHILFRTFSFLLAKIVMAGVFALIYYYIDHSGYFILVYITFIILEVLIEQLGKNRKWKDIADIVIVIMFFSSLSIILGF